MARPVVSQFKSPETRKIYDDAARFRAKIGLDAETLRTFERRVSLAVTRLDIRAGHAIFDELESLVRRLEFGEDEDD